MQFVKTIDTDILSSRLKAEVYQLLNEHQLLEKTQVSLTSINGDNNWDESTGKLHSLSHEEKSYSKLNVALTDTYIAELLARYPEYYRWRLLRINPRSCYSIHTDKLSGNTMNVRLHIPVVTNDNAFLCFFSQRPVGSSTQMVRYEHLSEGKSYRVNTTGFHTAVNHGLEPRYHIVGVKYEDSDNWSL